MTADPRASRGRAELAERLAAVVRARLPGLSEIRELDRCWGGVLRETWTFEAVGSEGTRGLALRRSPGGKPLVEGLALAHEARLHDVVRSAGVPAPSVYWVLGPSDGLGEGFLAERLGGEIRPRRVLRNAGLSAVRPVLARQCGELLARLHAAPAFGLEGLEPREPEQQFEELRARYDAFEHFRPAFELAFCWLGDHMIDPVPPALVHGEFRNGKLVVGEDGVRAVLDWELAHLGDPAEDLGALCAPYWRFGQLDRPVGGFGAREDLLAGYAAAGGAEIDPHRIRFWEVFAMVRQGITCMTMLANAAESPDRAVERAAIGRRTSATELELLASLAPVEA
jgi:aminoglycoside phosphotransferase (APT) family kinase protein